MSQNNKIIEEFKVFMAADASPPAGVEERVRGQVHRLLFPSPLSVGAKVLGLYGVAGVFVLLICPQFGLTLAARHGLFHYFSMFGEWVCMGLCGALFLGTGSLVASLALRPEELRRVFPLRYGHFLALALVAIAGLWAAGGAIALGLGAAWVVGGVLAESLVFDLVYRYRCAPAP